ncbi:class I fructose-bisphosphate aldolase [Sphingobacterium humi]|uniref:Aldolase n=1 Tax=Sphingobacterium humi TaxID=1796905 RepID=A0A6N8L2E1_9SPHI|nr:aldolase [Sphingobacterium humi]MVZ63905.1 aldolase [Sphingobacterium humi]
MKSYRLNRLFNSKSGHCFDVAIDHGFFNEYGFLQGIESVQKSVDILVDAAPDAIQLTVGQADYLQSIPGREKPSLVLRTDVANVYGKQLPRTLFSRMIENPIEQAIRLDAVCVVVNLFSIPDEPEVTDQCIQNILKIKPEADRYGIPLMVEPLVFRPNSEAGGYMVNGDPEKIIPLVRQGVELGADIIKADPTDDVSLYHRVVEIAGKIPVLVRGGGKASDAEILERTYQLMQQGVKGIVYGRNVIQHANPGGMTQALMAIVHEGKKPAEVIDLLS